MKQPFITSASSSSSSAFHQAKRQNTLKGVLNECTCNASVNHVIKEKVSAINVMLEQLSVRTYATIAGPRWSNSLSKKDGGADSYIICLLSKQIDNITFQHLQEMAYVLISILLQYKFTYCFIISIFTQQKNPSHEIQIKAC